MNKYKVVPGSGESHYYVVDDVDSPICECFNEKEANLICELLNINEKEGSCCGVPLRKLVSHVEDKAGFDYALLKD